jgi:hypothetical protein
MMGVVVTSHFMSNYNSIGFYDVIGNNLANFSMNFMCKRKKGGLFLPLFFPISPYLTASFVCMYGGIDGCLEERSDFMDLTQKKKKARVHTLIFVFDQASTLAVVGFKSTSCMHAGQCQIF